MQELTRLIHGELHVVNAAIKDGTVWRVSEAFCVSEGASPEKTFRLGGSASASGISASYTAQRFSSLSHNDTIYVRCHEYDAMNLPN